MHTHKADPEPHVETDNRTGITGSGSGSGSDSSSVASGSASGLAAGSGLASSGSASSSVGSDSARTYPPVDLSLYYNATVGSRCFTSSVTDLDCMYVINNVFLDCLYAITNVLELTVPR